MGMPYSTNPNGEDCQLVGEWKPDGCHHALALYYRGQSSYWAVQGGRWTNRGPLLLKSRGTTMDGQPLSSLPEIKREQQPLTQ
jgi:hypothetical protein